MRAKEIVKHDCETDNDCKGDLVCGDNNCKAFGFFFRAKDDCCIKPSPSMESFPKTMFPLTVPPPGMVTIVQVGNAFLSISRPKMQRS